MKRKRPSRPAVRQPSRPESQRRSWRGFFLAVLAALYVARPLLPSEAVAWGGDGQPFNMMWMLLAAGVFFEAARKGDLALRWTAADLAVAALVALSAISAICAARSGNPRPSINMLWEWIALGLGFFLVRLLVRSEREVRAIVAAMIALAVVLSIYGYYQYFVGMPAEREQYVRHPDEALRQAGRWYPKESPERKMFEDRLYSDEPTATFALTNSLAGYLAPWLVVALGAGFLQLRRGRSNRGTATMLIAVVAIAGCFLLTKSRSAYIAAALGVVLVSLYALAGRRSVNWKIMAGACAVLAALIAGAIAVKGLDAAVLSEAGKSLAYRFQYWESTLAMIREFPWLGVGPGSFQDYYTHFKLPAASEEVSDPHNLLFEIWATAGTPAAVALLALLGCWGRTMLGSLGSSWRDPVDESEGHNRDRDSHATRPIFIALGAAGGLLFAFLLGPLTRVPLSGEKLLAGLVVGGGVMAFLLPWVRGGSFPRLLPAIAVAVLVVHLSAAGGIAFPGVAGSLWLSLALSLNLATGLTEQKSEQKKLSNRGRVGAGLALGAVLLAACACYGTAYRPVLNSFSAMQRADEADTVAARQQALLSAAAADPFSAEPWEHLAQLRIMSWKMQPTTPRRQEFELAVERVLELRPQASVAWRQAGQWQMEIHDKTNDPQDARRAADFYSRGIELYPNSASLRGEYALSLEAAGNEAAARREAAHALRLDRITPHLDKKLSADQRLRMNAIAGAK